MASLLRRLRERRAKRRDLASLPPDWREKALADFAAHVRSFFEGVESRGEDARSYPLAIQLGEAFAKAARKPETVDGARALGREFQLALRRTVQRHGGDRGHAAPRSRRESRGRPVRRRGSRRVAATRAGPDDPEGEPEPPGLALWRHPEYGRVNPPMYRALLAVGR